MKKKKKIEDNEKNEQIYVRMENLRKIKGLMKGDEFII